MVGLTSRKLFELSASYLLLSTMLQQYQQTGMLDFLKLRHISSSVNKNTGRLYDRDSAGGTQTPFCAPLCSSPLHPAAFHGRRNRWHDAHLFAALVVTIDDPKARQVYDRVRALFNGTRPPGWKPIPPFEEWQGISACCNHVHCRYVLVPLLATVRARDWECLQHPGSCTLFSLQRA